MEPVWAKWETGDVLEARRMAARVLAAPSTPEDADEARTLLSDARNPLKVLAWGFLALALICGMILIAALRY